MATTKKAAEPKAEKWIRVEDQLPPEGTAVLFTTTSFNGKERLVTEGYHVRGACFTRNGRPAIAWMPLPDPYAGK